MNIEGYNRCDLIGLWKFVRALFKKDIWEQVKEAETNNFVPTHSI
jgi:hypothetical protein